MLYQLFLCVLLCHLGQSVKITSTGRIINVNTKDTQEVTMRCEVQFEGSESLLKNLVYWFKIQNLTILNLFRTDQVITTKLNNPDSTITPQMERAVRAVDEISALLSLQIPFDDPAKFLLNNDEEVSEKKNIISLTVKSLVPQDNGLYVCAVKQSGSLPLITADYTLNILQPVVTLMMTGSPEVPMNRTNMTMNQGSPALVYHENKDGYFECRSEGGYPAPQLSVFIGDTSITGNGLNDAYTNYTLIGDLGGRKIINPIRWINTTTFKVNKEMNNKQIRCQAEIRTANSTFHNTTASKTLIVYYAPHIDCKETEISIPLGGAKIPVKCEIHARPTPEISWTAKSSNVKVMSNDNTPNNLGLKAVTEVSTSDDKMIVTLTFDEVKQEHFQEYDVVAENVVGRSLISVTIKDGELRVDESNSASSFSVTVLLSLLVAALQLLVTLS